MRAGQHAARRRPHRPAVVVFAAVAVAVAEGGDEGGVDGHAREELADLGWQRLLLMRSSYFRLYRARLKGFGQVERMLQASSGRCGKQQQLQNSLNLAEALLPSPVVL